ncbi:hypothetical protein SAMN04487969_102202 [Paenibacillus algorifonticola]|uniref:Uncharacterized protein n=1 Tax=Paenibacillus algorifonticola TaxID=684063 RepID=A0A1I1ZZX8_9BACL|nr:hypothetical protein SAMN04487969_102202 [Paenibacillus algorifonticola]
MGAEAVFQRIRFSEIKLKLPRESWYYLRNEQNDGEFEEEEVWYYKGDLRLSELLLDLNAMLILVEGNLIVDRYIGNTDTDGATGLIVLGDMRASHMVAGGQEIHVVGNLQVDEMFWGDYNHGDLIVEGNMQAKLMITSDQYRVRIQGTSAFERYIEDWDDFGVWQGFDMTELFVPEIILDEDEEPSVWREEMLRLLEEDKPILYEDRIKPIHEQPQIPFLFEDTQLQPLYMQQVTADSLCFQGEPEDTSSSYEFWLGDQFFRATAYGNEATSGHFRSVYFQDGEEYGALLKIEPVVAQSVSVDQSRTMQWQLSGKYRRVTGEHTDWSEIDDDSPAVIQQLCQQNWAHLLQAVSTYEYARHLIDPLHIRELLALPLVEPYNDYYDEERNGLWIGDVYFAFRQEGELYNDAPQSALVRLARDYTDEQGDAKVEYFSYRIQKHMDGSECVSVQYSEDEDDDDYRMVNYEGGAKLLDAVKFFEKGKKLLARCNQDMLDGTKPFCGEDFAMEYWREKGYIS